MSKEFSEMTKAELAEMAVLYKVEDKVEELAAERAREAGKGKPKVPSNECYVEVLEGLKAERAEDAPKVEAVVPGKVGNDHSSKGKTMAKVRRDFLHTKVPVRITDHDNSTSTEEERVGKVINIGWGNKRGKETARIALDAGVQYVKEGAIQAMRDVKIPVNLKNKTIRDKSRFGIEETVGWDEAELERNKVKQKNR